jgi:uncharacterized protein
LSVPLDVPHGRSSDSRRVGLVILAGSFVGMLTGLIGVGGGFLIVPTLALVAKVPIKTAVGTSLLVIAMNSLAGFLGYFGQVEVPWNVLGQFTVLAIGATLVGTMLGRFVSQETLRRGFAAFLVGMATLVLYQNRGVLLVLG